MKHILIIDGNKSILEQYEFSFQAVKYKVTTADDCKDAYKKFKRENNNDTTSFDVVLVDMEIPGVSGMDCIREIRKKDMQTLIVAISYSTNKEMLIELMRLRCSDFVEKPVSFGELYTRIENALNWNNGYKTKNVRKEA